ncbi:MAG: S24 family peptidase [Gemmatimonadota bacterium]
MTDQPVRALLTPIEQKVYHFLLDHLAEHTFQPSVRDIARHCRIASTKTVTDLLASLEAKGYVEREPGRSRGVKLLGYGGPVGVTPIPVVRVAAGTTAQVVVSSLSLDRTLVPSDECFLVEVSDDAARSLGVLAGDLAMVHPVARSRDGDTVVVRVGGQALVRTMQRRGQAVVLSADAGSAPLELGPGDDFAVLGVLAAVIRPPATSP